MLTHDTLIIASVDPEIRRELRGILDSEYNVLEASSSDQLKLLLKENLAQTAAILLDIRMKELNGKLTAAVLYEEGTSSQLPVLSIVSEKSPANELIALDKGASELLYFPFHSAVVRHRIDSVVSLFYNKKNLQAVINEQATAIHNSYEMMVDTLSAIIEHRSVESGQHVLRIRRFTKLLLEAVALFCPEYSLTKDSIQAMASASALHDIGKISIPDQILNKPARLSHEEFEVMKTHTLTGSKILESFKSIGNEEYLRYAYNICRSHHERFDGTGYPDGLSGDDIPLCAQVVGLVDAYDALTTDRVYKKAIPYLEASNMIINGECGAFSPKLLECFKHVRGSFEALARSYADGYSPKSDAISVPLPPPKQAKPDSLQEAISKYRALLHHFGASAMEVDMETGVFHILYDPRLTLAPIKKAGTFKEAMRLFAELCVHPDDRSLITDSLDSYVDNFFRSGARKSVRRYRIKVADGEYVNHDASVIRIAAENGDFRKALVIWQPNGGMRTEHKELPEIFDTTLGATLILEYDSKLTFSSSPCRFLCSLGYSKENCNPESFLEIVEPSHREAFETELAHQLSSSDCVELIVPMKNGYGDITYCLVKGIVSYDSQSAEKLFCLVCDCDSAYRESQKHINNLAKYRSIIERTNDVLFQWDTTTDVMEFSENFIDRFGYEPIHDNASFNLKNNSHLHPDDVELFTSKVKELASSALPFLEVTLRIADKEGKYVWNRMRLTYLEKDGDRIDKLVGVITDVDGEVRRSEQLKEKSERDSLTKLYNKEAAKFRIDRLLMNTVPGKMGAFIIIDLDNFKEVNDRLGHLFGDSLLASVADALAGMFRESDVVARIGGDEFLVYMPSVSDKELVLTRCNELIKVLGRLIEDMQTELPVSCSVGVALHPEHGMIYSDLFQKADLALYHAKLLGKGRCQFYDSTITKSAYSAISKHIDSNEHLGIADNSLTEYVFQRLYETNDVFGTVNSVLELIGKQLRVDRVYVFENDDANTACFNTFEWCAEGVEPQIDNLQNINYEESLQGYRESFDERGLLYCTDIKELPAHIRAIVEPQGIRAMLHCAIRDNGVFKGYVGLDDCHRTRAWTKDQISMLSFLSQMLSVFLLKVRAQARSDALLNDLKQILDTQFSWVYVIDPADYTVSFCNGRTLELVPHLEENSICYKVFLNKSAPCSDCPILKGEAGGCSRIRNEYLGLTVNANASVVHWDGKKQWLITCNEIKD